MDSSHVRADVGIEGTRQSASLERIGHKEAAVNRTENFTAPGHLLQRQSTKRCRALEMVLNPVSGGLARDPAVWFARKEKNPKQFSSKRKYSREREMERSGFEKGRGYG